MSNTSLARLLHAWLYASFPLDILLTLPSKYSNVCRRRELDQIQLETSFHGVPPGVNAFLTTMRMLITGQLIGDSTIDKISSLKVLLLSLPLSCPC